MKKYLGLLIVPLMFIASNALADTLMPGVQAQGGTITEYSAQVNCDVGGRYGCTEFDYGAYGGSSLNLVINGTTINSQSFNMTGTQTVTAAGSWSFNSGDDIEITDTEPCFDGYCPVGNIQDGTISLTGSITLAVIAGVPACTNGTVLNTTTMACSIDNVNSGVTGYVYTLLAHYWPFVVGAGVLVGVWHFGMAAITLF
jgi:hypothetical protein